MQATCNHYIGPVILAICLHLENYHALKILYSTILIVNQQLCGNTSGYSRVP